MSHASAEIESEETSLRDSKILNQKILLKIHLDGKLSEYRKQCFRYNTKRVKLIEECIVEEIAVCNLHDYIIGTLQCKIMFDTFALFPSTRLTSICLKNNHLDGFCCDSIARFLLSSVTLQELSLEGCKIGDEGVNILIDGFENSVSLMKLNLSNNCISDNVGGELVKFLCGNNTCQDLNVSSNQLCWQTAKNLGIILSQNATLKRLDISSNRLYEKFAIVEILTGLKENESLEYLDISWNGLYGQPFGNILSKSVKSSKLKIFKLEHNELTTFEYMKLAVGMKHSKTIEECYIGGNTFRPEDDEILINVFTTKSPLRLLSLGKFFYVSQATHKSIKEVKNAKPHIQIIYQNVCHPNPPRDVSVLDICADRAKFLAMKPRERKKQRNMGYFMLKLKSLETPHVPKNDFLKLLSDFNARLDTNLIDEYIEASSDVADGKKHLNVHLMANHYLNRHPFPKVNAK